MLAHRTTPCNNSTMLQCDVLNDYLVNKSILKFWYNLVTMNKLIIPKTFIVLISLIMNVCICIHF